MVTLFQRLQAGEITVAEWQTKQGELVKYAHIANYAVAKGGYHKLTQSDLGRIGAIVKKQYAYLNRFAAQMAAHPGVIQTDYSLRRAASYATAGLTTFEAIRMEREVAAGARWARRTLHATESCASCVSHAGRWIKVEEMPPIGSLTCNIHCKCTIEYASTKFKPRRKDRPVAPAPGRSPIVPAPDEGLVSAGVVT